MQCFILTIIFWFTLVYIYRLKCYNCCLNVNMQCFKNNNLYMFWLFHFDSLNTAHSTYIYRCLYTLSFCNTHYSLDNTCFHDNRQCLDYSIFLLEGWDACTYNTEGFSKYALLLLPCSLLCLVKVSTIISVFLSRSCIFCTIAIVKIAHLKETINFRWEQVTNIITILTICFSFLCWTHPTSVTRLSLTR